MGSVKHSRYTTAFVSAASFFCIVALSACGGGGTGTVLQPLPSRSSAPDSTSKSIAFASAGTTQALPQVGGMSSTIVLPANDAPPGAELNVAVSTTGTSAAPQIPAGNPLALAYFAMTPSSDVTLNGSPKVSMTLAKTPPNQGQFYAWLYDTSTKAWLDLAPVTVQGTQIVFGGTKTTLALKRGVQYLAVPFTATQFASCPTPAPTPTPIPFTGKAYFAGNTVGSTGALTDGLVLAYDESTGKQTSTVDMHYPTGTIVFSSTLSSNGNVLYVTAGTANNNGNAFASGLTIPALTLVNTATDSVAEQSTIPASIFSGTLSADQTRFYGSGYDGSKSTFAVFVFDASTGAELSSIPLPSGTQLDNQIIVADSTDTAYVLDPNAYNVYKVNLASGTASVLYHESTSSDRPLNNIALDPAASTLYLDEAGRILDLDPATGSIKGTIMPPAGVQAFHGMSQSADRKTLLVFEQLAQSPGNAVAVISADTGSIVNSFTLAQYWNESALDANGQYSVLFSTEYPQSWPPAAYAIPSGSKFYGMAEPPDFWIEAAAAQ